MKGLMNNQVINQTGAQKSSAFGNSYLFTGRRLDDRAGIYYNRNRYNEPTVGRFISRDSLKYIDGLNCYAYTNNNPTIFKDSFGTEIIPGDGSKDGCDGYVYVYSKMSYTHKRRDQYGINIAQGEARTLTVHELNDKETQVREYAIQQCINAGRKKGSSCILQGRMEISPKSSYESAETQASRRNRRIEGNDRNSKTQFVTTARTGARFRCRNVARLRNQIKIENIYVSQDLGNIQYEEDKRDLVENISYDTLRFAAAYKLIRAVGLVAIGIGAGGGIAAGVGGRTLVGAGLP